MPESVPVHILYLTGERTRARTTEIVERRACEAGRGRERGRSEIAMASGTATASKRHEERHRAPGCAKLKVAATSAADAKTRAGTGGRRSDRKRWHRGETTGEKTSGGKGGAVQIAADQRQRSGGGIILADSSQTQLQILRRTAADGDIHRSTKSKRKLENATRKRSQQAAAFRGSLLVHDNL